MAAASCQNESNTAPSDVAHVKRTRKTDWPRGRACNGSRRPASRELPLLVIMSRTLERIDNTKELAGQVGLSFSKP